MTPSSEENTALNRFSRLWNVYLLSLAAGGAVQGYRRASALDCEDAMYPFYHMPILYFEYNTRGAVFFLYCILSDLFSETGAKKFAGI